MKAALKKNQQHVLTLEEAKDYIDQMDLTHVIERVMKERWWTRRMAEVTARFYKNFLWLSKKYPEKHFSPTKQIDHIWHAHILYTKDYHEMCERVFGHYLHHQPTHEKENNSAEESSEGNILFEAHNKEFGCPIYDAVFSFKDIGLLLSSKLR